MEAENYHLGTRWTVGADSDALNGEFVEIYPTYNYTGSSSPECNELESIVSYEFDITIAGNYRFWFRLLSTTAVDDIFFRNIDGHGCNFQNNEFSTSSASWFGKDNGVLDILLVVFTGLPIILIPV